MKKLRALIVVIYIIITIGCFTFSSCAVYLDIFDENYTEWYTEDEICGCTSALSGAAYGYVMINGIKVRALFEVTPTASVKITIRYNEELNLPKTIDGITYYYKDDFGEYYSGEFRGKRKDNIFTTEDFSIGALSYRSFNMYSRKVEPTTINARDYVYCFWRADNNSIIIEDSFISAMDVYWGTISMGEEVPIRFKWCDNNRFEIYNGEEGATEIKLLASGSYTNVATELSLTFEEDTTFGLQGQTVQLNGSLN